MFASGARPIVQMPGAGALLKEEVDFLQAVVESKGRPLKRRAMTWPAAAPEPSAEDLLVLPPTSDLDIAGCGPRAAGMVLASMLSCEKRRRA